MENYFNYFTEIEERFQRRRRTVLMLSTLDWALIETWKDAGIPLAAVLRGIDSAFDKYDRRPSKTRKVNSLAYCAQEVLAAAEEMNQAAAGTSKEAHPKGFDRAEIAAFLRRNAGLLESVELPSRPGVSPGAVAREVSLSLNELAQEIEAESLPSRLEDLERKLTLFEEKLLALLLAAVPDDEVCSVRGQADRELAPYRRKMPSAQIEQLQKQYVYKRLMEKYGVPRLSLFYL
ncbi:MAG: hypothetical protein J2P13_02180 [Acidobacteria bacterium]|nr:hypothetical protein [Acidobacteriota bacterium]